MVWDGLVCSITQDISSIQTVCGIPIRRVKIKGASKHIP